MITSSQRILLYTLLIISLSWAGQMQLLAQGNTTHQLRLKNGVQGLQANAAHWLDSVNNSAASGAMLIYIHFNTLPDAAQRATMKKNGISLLDYIPDNTFSAVATPPFNTSVITALPVYAIVNVQTEWKADERTWKKLSTEKGYVDMLVSFYPFIDAATAKQFIAAAGAQINAGPMERYGAYRITIAAGSVHSIASWYGVKYISPATSMAPLDLQSRPAVKGNIAVNPTTAGGYGLNGDSVTVGVGDNGSAIYHADLKDRVLNFNPASLGNVHGEHVNGIVGGAGTIDPMAEGMATHVTLADYLYDQVVAATGTMYTDHHMTITNNSYGVILNDCDYSGTYDAYAQFVDTLAMEYPEVLHVFASGNDGYDVCSPYPLSFGTVAGGYQPAKNNVVVGSMTDGLDAAVDESRGPAKDGRLKPEIVAVGLGAYSTVGIDGYEWDAGTSMASPQVSGGLALLTQRYKQLNGTQPKADELKAILLNGAMDRGNPGPDFTYGFGTMDLHRSLGILDSSWYSSNTLNNNDSQTINITISSNTAQLKVLLCWADRPASPSSAVALVNDLDLTVQAPSGTIHLPLVADGTPANVTHVATEQADHLNNVEQVTILHPAAGNYAVKVKGYNVPFAGQRYVLAWDMMPDGVQLTYPNGGEAWENTDTLRIFWEAVSDTNTFTIDFSADNGGSWTTLSANVPSWRRYYGWMPTGINSGSCKMRITENSTSSVSVSGTFAINTIPVVHLDTAQCPGYIALHWSPVPNATAYQLLSKTGNYMQPVATITDTAYIFSGMWPYAR